jgi:hypothetical protein
LEKDVIVAAQGSTGVTYNLSTSPAPGADVDITAKAEFLTFSTATVKLTTADPDSSTGPQTPITFDIPSIAATEAGYQEVTIEHTIDPANAEYANAIIIPNPLTVVITTAVQAAEIV